MHHPSVRDYKFHSREECWWFWRLAVGMKVEVIEGYIRYCAASPRNYNTQIQKVLIQYSTRYKRYQLTIITEDDPGCTYLKADFSPEKPTLWNPHGITSDSNIIDLEHLFERVCAAHTDLLLLSSRNHKPPNPPSNPFSRFVQHPLCDFGGLYRLMRNFWCSQ